MNPQEKRSSRSSRGEILKRKVSQDPQDHQEERFSRWKFLKSLKRKDHQDRQQEEKFSSIELKIILMHIVRIKSYMDSIVSQYFMEFSSLDRLLLWWVPILLSYDCLLPIALTFMLNVGTSNLGMIFFPIFILSYPFLDFINNCYLERDQNLFQILFVFSFNSKV